MSFIKGSSPPQHKENCRCFRCSGVAWNLGKTWSRKERLKRKIALQGRHISPMTEIKKGERISPKTEFKRKDKDLTYMGLHSWIHRKLGQANKCEKCGTGVNVDWANKSHKYLEDLNDWIQLCGKCHHKYDNISTKIWKSRRKNGTDKWREEVRAQ